MSSQQSAAVAESVEDGEIIELDEGGEVLEVAEVHADRVAVHAGPAGDQRRPVERLELVEFGAVDDACDDLARVERDA